MLAYLLIGGGVLLALVALAWGRVKLPSLPTFAKAESVDDSADLAAFNRVKARMVRLKCPEGIAAITEVGRHFLHDAGAHG